MKEITNGNGTSLVINKDAYISIGKNGNDISIRGNGKVICFNTWEEFISSINISKANYYKED